MSILRHRVLREEDRPFLFSTWRHSFRDSHDAGLIPMDMYDDVYTQVIERVLKRPNVACVVAVSAEDEDQILGWICFDVARIPVVHYIYVKEAYRRMGVAQGLFHEVSAKDAFLYTFRTPMTRVLVSSRGANHDNHNIVRFGGRVYDARFSPNLIRKPSRKVRDGHGQVEESGVGQSAEAPRGDCRDLDYPLRQPFPGKAV